MKRLIIVGIIVVVVGGMGYVSFMGQAISVEMAEVTTTSVYEYISEDAKTRLDDEYIVDMPVMGTLERMDVEIGDMVKKGQLIGLVDPYSMKQQILQVKAMIKQSKAQVDGVDVQKPKSEDIESAQLRIQEMNDALLIAEKDRKRLAFNLEESKNTYERAKGLLDAGAGSQSEFDEADLAYKGLQEDLSRAIIGEAAAKKSLEQAELTSKRLTGSIDDNEYMRDAFLAEIQGLEAQLAALEDDLKKTKIKAPVTGPLLEKFIEDRRLLLGGEPLLKIGDLSSIEIECDVLSEEITPMKTGNKVEISGKALGNEVIYGKISRIYPSGFMKISSLGVEQQRVRTIIEFDNSEIGLRPGTSVDVKIITAEKENTLAIPDRALFRSEGQWAVFCLEGNTVELRTVEVGLRNDDWAEIISGVKEGATIVAELKNELVNGSRVSRLN
jgi:HlyD family secretion protein